MRITLVTLAFLLMGCPISWENETASLRKQEDWRVCHFDEEDIELARPDGYPCRSAACSADGTHYWQRGVCSQSGTLCSAPLEATYCAPTEECFLMALPGTEAQALCVKSESLK